MDKYTKHVRLFMQNISHAWFPIVVVEEDKYVVKRLDEAPRMHFPGVLSPTRVTEQQFLSLVRHSLWCLIAKTKIPNGVEEFLTAYSQKRSNGHHRQQSPHYQSINTAGGNAPKPTRQTPSARCGGGGPPTPPPPFPRGPPTPPKTPALHPMPAAVPLVDDFNYVDSAREAQKRCVVTRP